MEQGDLFEPFVASRRRTNIGLGIGAGVLLAAAGGSLALDVDPTGKYVLAGLLGAMGGLAGLGAVLGMVRPDRALVVLRERPGDVVWISPTRNFYNGAHQTTSYKIKLRDGSEVGLAVGPKFEADADRVLRTVCPEADFGYDSDLAAKHSDRPGDASWAPAKQGGAAMTTLYDAVRRGSRVALWFGIPTLLVAAFLVAMTIGVQNAVPGVMAGVFALVGGYLLKLGIRKPQRHPMVRLIEETPAQVEALSVRYVAYGGKPEPELGVTSKAGKRYTVTLPSGSEKPLLAELSTRVPHAFQQ